MRKSQKIDCAEEIHMTSCTRRREQSDLQNMKKQIETTTLGKIRALEANGIQLPPIICDNGDHVTWATFELPTIASAWLARHPEANTFGRPEGRLGVHRRAPMRRATVASVLAAPSKHRAAELRAYRVRLKLARFAIA
jgi:hypothetical protein